jgi:peroxiredoxin
MKPWISGLFLVCLVWTTAWAQDENETTLMRIGQTVPGFTIRTIDGQQVSMDGLRGRVVLLNFFATWCPPCNQEMPHLEKMIWQRWKKDELMLLAIGREHSGEELKAYKKEKGVTFFMAPDPERQIYGKFATQYIPRNVLVDREGKIVYQSRGYTEASFQELVDTISGLMEND